MQKLCAAVVLFVMFNTSHSQIPVQKFAQAVPWQFLASTVIGYSLYYIDHIKQEQEKQQLNVSLEQMQKEYVDLKSQYTDLKRDYDKLWNACIKNDAQVIDMTAQFEFLKKDWFSLSRQATTVQQELDKVQDKFQEHISDHSRLSNNDTSTEKARLFNRYFYS